MTSSAVLQALTMNEFLRGAGVLIIALLLWGMLVLLSSFFLKRVGPARGIFNQARFLLLPALIFYLAVRLYWPGEDLALKIAKTVLATALVSLVLGFLDLVLSPKAIRRRFGRDVPQLFVDVGRHLLLVLAVAVILKSVWEEDVAPLIGALGIGGIVLGLALQETLSNFFSGLSILADRPFSLGDWVKVGEGVEGQVEHITWRAVRIRTRSNEYIIYPNSMVAKERVVNFNLPTTLQALRLSIGASYQAPPDLVKRTILQVVEEVEGVLCDPPPSVGLSAYADSAINYDIKFFIQNFAARGTIEDMVLTRLWYAFRRHGIEIPFPTRTLYHQNLPAFPAAAAPAPETTDGAAAAASGENEIRAAIGSVAIFADLSAGERAAVARGAGLEDYCPGERVIRQGQPGDALYAIAAGTARITVRSPEGVEKEVAVLQAGEVFGEMSLLTGEPRSASVYAQKALRVVEVGKAALSPILSANPSLAAKMAEVVVLRREGLDRAKAQAALEGSRRAEVAAATSTLLGRIRFFFGLGG